MYPSLAIGSFAYNGVARWVDCLYFYDHDAVKMLSRLVSRVGVPAITRLVNLSRKYYRLCETTLVIFMIILLAEFYPILTI